MTTRVPDPTPSLGTDIHRYLRGVANALNSLPNFSVFSAATPNSNVMANAPTLGFNTSSSGSKLWVKTVGSGSTGWVALA